VPLIDRHLPVAKADFSERHERVVETAAERVLQIGLAAPAAPDPIVATLMRLRRVPRAETIAELLDALGLERLEGTATEVVYGGKLWPKIYAAVDLRGERLSGDRSRAVTETRVAADDDRSRQLFRLYWLAVRPFSGLIRRRWLAEIARRAAAG